MIHRTLAQYTFYALAAVLIAWTASLTYSFIGAALPESPWYVPAFGLVVFDAGMLSWLFVFLHHAEGADQRAVAIAACTIDLLGVGLMVLSEILLGGQTWTAAPENLATYAVWGIAIWTIINVTAVIAYHLLSPEARQQMALQSEKDAIFDAALKSLTKKREQNSGRLADRLSDGMLSTLEHELFADENGDGIPDRLQRERYTPGRNGVEISAIAEAPHRRPPHRRPPNANHREETDPK